MLDHAPASVRKVEDDLRAAGSRADVREDVGARNQRLDRGSGGRDRREGAGRSAAVSPALTASEEVFAVHVVHGHLDRRDGCHGLEVLEFCGDSHLRHHDVRFEHLRGGRNHDIGAQALAARGILAADGPQRARISIGVFDLHRIRARTQSVEHQVALPFVRGEGVGAAHAGHGIHVLGHQRGVIVVQAKSPDLPDGSGLLRVGIGRDYL